MPYFKGKTGWRQLSSLWRIEANVLSVRFAEKLTKIRAVRRLGEDWAEHYEILGCQIKCRLHSISLIVPPLLSTAKPLSFKPVDLLQKA